MRDTLTTGVDEAVAVTVHVAAEEADVTAVDELTEQIPLLVTLDVASRSGGDDEDISEDEMAVGMGGDRGMPRIQPPPE